MNPFAQELEAETQRMRQEATPLPELDYFWELAGELYQRRSRELKVADGPSVGALCHFVPEELASAAGVQVIRLCGGCLGAVKVADPVLPGRFCPLVKASLGWSMARDDLWDHLSAIIVPTTCDAKLKLGELLAADRPVWQLEVPATTETPQSRRLWLDSLGHLRRELENLSKTRVTGRRLKEAVAQTDAKRKLIRQLYGLANMPAPPLRGSEILMVASLSFMDEPRRWLDHAGKLLEAARAASGDRGDERDPGRAPPPRLLLTGSPTIWPHFKLPRLIEATGGHLVVDELCNGTKTLWDPIGPVGGPLSGQMARLANGYLAHACACFSPNLGRLAKIRQLIKEFRVDGVVHANLPGCQVYGMEAPRFKEAMAQDDMPLLLIEADYGEEDWGQLSIRMEAFMELLAGRKDEDGLY